MTDKPRFVKVWFSKLPEFIQGQFVERHQARREAGMLFGGPPIDVYGCNGMCVIRIRRTDQWYVAGADPALFRP